MDLRQQKILNAIIKEYVNIAQPISSGFLFNKYKLNLSSATIRAEMKELERQNYLYQPHASAGRVPTEKAYKFFIKALQEKEINLPDKKRKSLYFTKTIKKEDSPMEMLKKIIKSLAEKSGDLAFGGIKELNFLHTAGMYNLLKAPEFQDLDYFSKIIRATEEFDEKFENLFEEVSICQTRVFIGKENPINRSGKFTLIVSSCKIPQKKHGLLGIMGPIRMRYNQNIYLINKLRSYIEDFYE